MFFLVLFTQGMGTFCLYRAVSIVTDHTLEDRDSIPDGKTIVKYSTGILAEVGCDERFTRS